MNSISAYKVELDPRWQAVSKRDASQDGAFVYSVKSTGVYCRPSCPARLAKPANVAFHDSCAAAEAAGFRPCKRCQPEREDYRRALAARIEAACRLIDSAEDLPDLATLAAAAGLSPFHFHRQFKKAMGVTPKAYAAAQRQNRVQANLRRGDSVTAALYDAGFNSNAPFYQSAAASLGMKPGQYRRGGADVAIKFAVGPCSLGEVLVACSDIGICAILLGDDAETLLRDLQDRFAKATLIGGDPDFEAVIGKVIALVDRPAAGLDLPLDIHGTAFQRRVWQALRAIPAGQTTTYSAIADAIGSPQAVRAVAGACAANPLAVAVPCHRVIGKDGSLTGYRWGIDRKRRLLAVEAAE